MLRPTRSAASTASGPLLDLDASSLPPKKELAHAVAGFAVLTILLTYPQVRHLGSHVGTHYDALFSVWRLAWIAHQLRNDPLHLFDANIFYPEPNTLAYSDAILLLGVAGAPFIWAGASATVVYNVLVLLSFVSAGAAMYWFIRALGLSGGASMVSGILFAYQPYRFAHYPQLELLWTCWIPLAFWALHRAIATRQWRYGALVGLFTACQALCCLYYGVFLATILPIVALVLVWGQGRPLGLWKPCAAAILVATSIGAPYAWPYLQLAESTGPRLLAEVEQWSPSIRNYAIAQADHWLYPQPPPGVNLFEGVLFPGSVGLLLAAAACFRGTRRARIGYGVALLTAFDVSLGTNGFLFPHLFSLGFPYAGLRVSARMFVMVSAAMAVLAAIGAAIVEKRYGRIAGPVLAAACLVEFASVPIPLEPTPTIPRTYTWLAKQPDGAVFEWPVPRLWSLGLTREPHYMYFSTRHWKPLVNGYSGRHPESFGELLEQVRMHFPRESAVGYLARRGVRYVIVHSPPTFDEYRAIVDRLQQIRGLQLQFALRNGDRLAVFVIQSDPQRGRE